MAAKKVVLVDASSEGEVAQRECACVACSTASSRSNQEVKKRNKWIVL